ncbi:uncharacterized protein [Rutidosis leptorrhynchoides]|uniref:uncharacterized protein n=1 Tax=Rutidosis leptorrhynchoides TaxID=125765 RepID=UPI003A99FCAC
MSIDTANEPVIIKCRIPDHGIQIKRMHVDTGSGVNIMYEHYYRFLPAKVKAQLRQPDITLSGFSGESSWPLGRIELVVELADDKNPLLVRSELIDFYVVRSASRYNALLGRNFIRRLNIIPSVVHGLIKFPTMGGIVTIVSHQATELCGSVVHVSIPNIGEQLKSSAVIANRLHPDKQKKIGAGLSAETKAKLHGIFSANAYHFIWQESDMTGVPRDIAEHKLNVNPSLTPVRQKKRHKALERCDWLCAKVDNLDINKACPKDNYHLPEIDWKVESLSVKSNTEEEMLADILETFTSLRRINMKLNPLKCSFGEEEGKFLGHVVTARGIKANPKKIEAIDSLPSPRTKKDVQSLTGKLAEAESAFQEMKKLLAELPTLAAPVSGEMLTLYLAASKEAISSFLITDRGKAVVPAEIGVPMFRVQNFDAQNNSEALRKNLNLLEERRLSAAVNEVNNKQKIAKYYN